MLIRIEFFIFLLKLYFATIVIRFLDKYLLRGELTPLYFHKIKQIIKYYIFSEIRSTHDRRILSISKILIANLNLTHFQNPITRIEDDNLSFLFWPKLNYKYHVYLIGDSHSEFYGRCSVTLLNENKISPFVLWLGPRTFMGIYSSAMIDNYFEYCLSNIENAEKDIGEYSRYFAFSLGSIDIRTLFFQLTKFGPKMTEDELMEKFKNAADYFFESFILAFKNRWPKSRLGIFEVLFCVDSPGEYISSEKDLKSFIRVMPYPILGSHMERSSWCDSVNAIIKQCCMRLNVDFLPVNKHLTNNTQKILTQGDSSDGAHVTSHEIVDKIFSEIIDRIGLQNVG